MINISRESEINLINILIDQDIISGKDLINIKKVSTEGQKSQLDAVFELNLTDENKILDLLVKEQSLEVVDLSAHSVTEEIKSVLPSNYINMNFIAPFKVEGKILSQPIFVYNLGNKGQYGFDIYIPIETNGLVLLTRAGWVEKQFQIGLKDINRNVSIDAILLNPKRKNYFTPKNSKDLIFFLDMQNLKKNFKKNLFPLIAENRSNLLNQYNLKKPSKIELPNNHLQYALTWYSLCFVIIVAFLIYKRKL